MVNGEDETKFISNVAQEHVSERTPDYRAKSSAASGKQQLGRITYASYYDISVVYCLLGP